MIAVWMIYVLALGLLLGLAAHALERVAGLWGWPRRFVWAAAILASLLVPLAALMRPPVPAPRAGTPRTEPPPKAVATVAPVREMPSGARTVALNKVAPVLAAVNRPLLLLWCGASLLLLFRLLRSDISLRRRARSWRAMVVDETQVLVAPDIGPAVVRLGGLKIVLPDWALSAEPLARSLMLQHEREHCRTRDPDLLFGATVALVLSPWNLPLWWQVHRLQLAVETDCDRRVMRAGAEAQAYGGLLLRVGARRTRQLLAATAFSEAPSLLERRIRAMTSPTPRNPILRAALAGAAAALVLASAAMMPQPARKASQRPAAISQRPDTAQFAVLLRVRSTEPGREVRFKAGFDVDDHAGLQFVDTTTPFQVTGRTHAATAMLQKVSGDAELDAVLVVGTGADTQKVSGASGPRLVLQYNPRLAWLRAGQEQPTRVPRGHAAGVYREEDVTERPERVGGPAPRYPDSLRAAGVGGRVLVEFIVDSTGHVDPGSVRILSSTHPGFEAPTRDAIVASTFRPGQVQGHAVPVLMSQLVNFETMRGPDSAYRPPASDTLFRDGVKALQAQDYPRADSLLGLVQQRANGQELQAAMFFRGLAQFQRAFAAEADAQSKRRDAEKDPAVRAAACASVKAAGDFLNQAEPNIAGGAASDPGMAKGLLDHLPQMRSSLPELAHALNCPS